MRKLHICLLMVGSEIWMGGVYYIHNLARAINSLPEEEKEGVTLSISVPASKIDLVKAIQPYVDHIYKEGLVNRASLKLFRLLAEKVPLIPLRYLNPRKWDFVYPDYAGVRAPYCWGAWITDFQHLHLPEFFSQEDIDRRNFIFTKFAQAASVVILSSQTAHKEFCKLFPEAKGRSVVLRFASWMEPSYFKPNPEVTQQKYGLPEKFFLVCNQFWKHKNHEIIFEALRLLKDKNIFPTVVCTGNTMDDRDPQFFNQIHTKIKQWNIEPYVKILGLIPRLDQIQLMRGCLAVIQPSLFEGWSTVVEDARSLGKNLLLSDLPIHIEQNPPHTKFFKRKDAGELASLLAEGMDTLSPGPDLKREVFAQKEGSKNLQNFGRSFLKIVREAVK